MVTIGVVIVLVVAAIGLGIWQDRGDGSADTTALGMIDQVEPSGVEAQSLSTAPEVGSRAPNFRLETTNGEVMELADLRGTPVFLNFWATWCFFCLTEMPAMQIIADEYGDDVVVLGVSAGDSKEDASTYAGNNDIRYMLALDTDKVVTEAYGVRQMPTSMFIDENGVVENLIFGVIVPDQMRENIDAMLIEDSANASGTGTI
jgi:peroxiredoxin